MKWDLDDEIILGGIQEKQLTTPLMNMLERQLQVMDTSMYCKCVFEKMKQWMADPSELLRGQVLLFPDFPPDRDERWDVLFALVSEVVEDYTKQALIIMTHSLCLCLQCQLTDPFPGGKYFEASDRLRSETNTCQKHNLAPEYLFSILNRKERERERCPMLSLSL